jgi:hypothetical protein
MNLDMPSEFSRNLQLTRLATIYPDFFALREHSLTPLWSRPEDTAALIGQFHCKSIVGRDGQFPIPISAH